MHNFSENDLTNPSKIEKGLRDHSIMCVKSIIVAFTSYINSISGELTEGMLIANPVYFFP